MESTQTPSDRPEIFTTDAGQVMLEEQILPGYITSARWFGGKAKHPRRVRVVETFLLEQRAPGAALLAVEVEYAEAAPEIYLLPLEVVSVETAEDRLPIAQLDGGRMLCDALEGSNFRAALLKLIADETSVEGLRGSRLRGVRGAALRDPLDLPSRLLRVEQSNSSVVFGEQLFAKVFRKLDEGLNLDVEITRFLSEERKFPHVPPFAGMLEWQRSEADARVCAVLIGWVPSEGDAWKTTLREVEAYFQRVLEPADEGVKASALLGSFRERAALLGTRTAEMHLALSAPEGSFAPEPFGPQDLAALSRAVKESSLAVFALLGSASLPPAISAQAKRLFDAQSQLFERLAALRAIAPSGEKIRTHGDYHLGQVLDTGSDFVMIDFEGEPQRSLAERRKKQSPLRDVAGMLRSFHYAAHSGLNAYPEERERLSGAAEVWATEMGNVFLDAWVRGVAGSGLAPGAHKLRAALLDLFLLEKALYEVGYEVNNRPGWAGIPITGILRLISPGAQPDC